jgi:hypothetical protein
MYSKSSQSVVKSAFQEHNPSWIGSIGHRMKAGILRGSCNNYLAGGFILALTALVSSCSGHAIRSGPTSWDQDAGREKAQQPAALEATRHPSGNNGNGDPMKKGAISSWQWQLAGLPVDDSAEGAFFDIDLFETDADLVAELQSRGSLVICYLSAGSWEDWRPDADQFPREVLGDKYTGWPGERWLDIRRIDLLGPIMEARLDLCLAKGFDGVEPDNIDAFTNRTGFPLTSQDQLVYNTWLADQAHLRGLSIGLKNDPDQAADLEPYFDWALTEDCFAEGWCSEMELFAAAGKPVYAAEYSDRFSLDDFRDRICPQAEQLGYDLILKNRELDAWRALCP